MATDPPEYIQYPYAAKVHIVREVVGRTLRVYCGRGERRRILANRVKHVTNPDEGDLCAGCVSAQRSEMPSASPVSPNPSGGAAGGISERIRNGEYPGWQTSGSGNTVDFTESETGD